MRFFKLATPQDGQKGGGGILYIKKAPLQMGSWWTEGCELHIPI